MKEKREGRKDGRKVEEEEEEDVEMARKGARQVRSKRPNLQRLRLSSHRGGYKPHKVNKHAEMHLSHTAIQFNRNPSRIKFNSTATFRHAYIPFAPSRRLHAAASLRFFAVPFRAFPADRPIIIDIGFSSFSALDLVPIHELDRNSDYQRKTDLPGATSLILQEQNDEDQRHPTPFSSSIH
jgi:hypothetical protein